MPSEAIEECPGCETQAPVSELTLFSGNGVPPAYYCRQWCAEDVTGVYAADTFQEEDDE